ncbi:MAG: DNA mismatch repair endonuclease MutL [Oscillospiraceae bacterium]|nr:DNA mismatch repair endonuclease MutL [Oscillospiraceae bacterium]
MPHIQCLPPHVADLIAAGEVVERPASVVKELLENAIDAGSSAIVVEIQNGGMTYIRITDNGCGIAIEQLSTAFLRHATSKLRTANDLAAIGTLGFRGEALAAIAAVSRVDIFSRTADSAVGGALHIEGGTAGEATETGAPLGTTICVRDLFYNTPARMKFMKKDSAESAAISGVVQHLALSHPHISFKLIRDGQETLHTPGDGQLYSAVYAAMGRDFTLSLLPIEGRGGEVEVRGFITKPLHCHGSRGKQVLFVNGRFIKSQLLTAALEESYKNQIMKGRFPGCVLHVTLPPEMVDVNVHPAKTVVKFVSDKAVFDAVYYTVLDTLNGEKAPVQQAKKPADAPQQQQSFYRTMTAEEFRAKAPAAEKVPEKKPLGSFTAPPRREIPAAPPVRPSAEPVAVHDVAEKDAPFTYQTASTRYEITPPVKQEAPAKQAELPLPEKAPAPVAEQQTMMPAEAPWRMVGEVLKTYIICEDDSENIWLIDKHAAHERLRFDALKAEDRPLMSQPLLTPLTVALEAEEYAAAMENLSTLERFGFVCEDFGSGTLLVREISAEVRLEDAAATVEELCRKLAAGRVDPDAARDELYHTMACKSAIKAGMTSGHAELQALVEKVQSGEILYCPHGRPVKHKLSKYEIEKLFKRA